VAALELDLPDTGQPTDPRFHIRTVMAAAALISTSLREGAPAERVPARPVPEAIVDAPDTAVAGAVSAGAPRRRP
jgi:hypothetical protein